MGGNLCPGNGSCQKFDNSVSVAPRLEGLGQGRLSHSAILTPTERSQPAILKVRNGKEHSSPGVGGHSLTDHVVGYVDLDLSLVLEGHLALDTLVRLFLRGDERRNQVSRDGEPGPQKPSSRRHPRVACPLPGLPIRSLPTSLRLDRTGAQAAFQGAAPRLELE